MGNSDARVSACDAPASTSSCTRTARNSAVASQATGANEIWLYSLEQRTQNHDENATDHTQRQHCGDRLSVIGRDHGEQVCVLAPHPDEALVAPATGTEESASSKRNTPTPVRH